MKRITLIILAITAILFGSVSCQKDNIKPVEPIVPQGEVTREFLSRIRVGKDGHFQYWNQDSPALKELKAFVATVTDPTCKGYVPPQDRIATFDVDGTLMCETSPYYFNWMLFFHRYLHDDSFTPEEEDRKKVGLLFCLLELGLAFAAFLLTFLKKDGCSWKQVLLQSAIVSLFGATLFTMILPMQSYLVNQSDFKFGLGTLLISASGWCVLVWICLTLLLLCSERLWGRFVHVALTMFLVYAYLETGVLAIGQPPLNGEINYFLNRAMGLRDGLILVGLVAGGTMFTRWLKNWVHWISPSAGW